jgi:hypothetical protein
MQARIAIALLRNPQVRAVLLAIALLFVLLPPLVAASIVGLFDQQAESTCGSENGALNLPAGGGPLAAGMYAAPLQLRPGRWYEVGATEYGGPGDPTSGDYGSIPDPGESYLPAHPDTFAELSVLRVNPANGGSFTFQDANALNNLPYLTGLRVAHAGRESLLFKRDTGYGQGPGQLIENGQPYRLDIWWQAAQQLGVSKSPVQVQLAPRGTTHLNRNHKRRGSRAGHMRGARRHGWYSAAADAGDAGEDPAEWPRRRRRRSPAGGEGDGRGGEPPVRRRVSLRRRARHLPRHTATGV